MAFPMIHFFSRGEIPDEDVGTVITADQTLTVVIDSQGLDPVLVTCEEMSGW